MDRICVVTGAASGIGLATTRHLRARGNRVIACDLHDADVIADLVTPEGRAKLVAGVTSESGGKIDAIIANAGGGPPQISVSLNFFGAVATLEGLRPLLAGSAAPRAVAVSSVASLRPPRPALVEACLRMDETAAIALARNTIAAADEDHMNQVPVDVGLDLYGNAKLAAALVPKRRGQRALGGGRDLLKCRCTGFLRHPSRGVCSVGSSQS